MGCRSFCATYADAAGPVPCRLRLCQSAGTVTPRAGRQRAHPAAAAPAAGQALTQPGSTGPAAAGGDAAPVLRSHETPPGVLHPAPVPPAWEGCWPVGARKARKWSDGCSTSRMRTGWGSWGCSGWKRGGSRETLLQPLGTWRGPVKKMGANFLFRHAAIG